MKKMKITGRVLTVVPVLMLLMSATMKHMKPASMVEGFTHPGLPEKPAFGLGILELACTILYAVPRTAVLGAILVTVCLGVAGCTHLRVGNPFMMQVILGVVLWGGLFLREPRLRALIPLSRQS